MSGELLVPAPTLQVTCWGTRGSIPSPGPDTVRFGGNTPCVVIRTDTGRDVVLDAGSGLRAYGEQLTPDEPPPECDIFLTHYHWDHIQGLPFFAPLYQLGARLRLYGPEEAEGCLGSLMRRQMSEPLFPVDFDTVAADVVLGAQWPAAGDDCGLQVRSTPVCHGTRTLGYRVEYGGVAVVYMPDNDLGLFGDGTGAGSYAELVEFCRDADLMLHDSMFTDAEYAARPGWGHSTFQQAIALAETAGVRHLQIFHHAPERSDAALCDILGQLQSELAARGSTLHLSAAAELVPIHLTALP